MRINTILFSSALLFLFSCKTPVNESNKEMKLFPENIQAFTVSEVLADADNHVDKEIIFEGLVNHVCSHSGKRCFLVDGNNSIRVEAMGNIASFNRELSGNKIMVKGILREKQIDESRIDEMECNTKEKQANSHNAESCQAELDEIQTMRDWMKEKDKNYYSVWYVDGIDYEEIN